MKTIARPISESGLLQEMECLSTSNHELKWSYLIPVIFIVFQVVEQSRVYMKCHDDGD